MSTVNCDLLKSQIKSWLNTVLPTEDINNFSIELEGSNEKGEGYMGDVFFITLATDQKIYNLVLKCSKRSAILRKKNPSIKTVFYNEKYAYQTIFPTFQRYELEKDIAKPFDSVPKFYGSIMQNDHEVLVLQNMKSLGYSMCDRRTPLNLEHILSVVRQYGEFHAISAAFQDQKPEELKKLLAGILPTGQKFKESMNLTGFCTSIVQNTCSELKDEVDSKILERWGKLSDKIDYFLSEAFHSCKNTLKVISDGDCWNNNFMFHYDKDNRVSKVVILDWQMIRFTTPIVDLSFFLFATISGNDLKHVNFILKEYHRAFSNHLEKLGSDARKLFPFNQFLVDWKEYSSFALLLINLNLKMCLAEKGEVKNMDEVAAEGKSAIEEVFNIEIQNKNAFKKRIKPIIEYAVANNLI